MRIMVTLIVIFACFGSANAQVIQGNDLVGWMKEFDKAESHATDFSWYDTAYFMGFVMGVYDSHEDEFGGNDAVNVSKIANSVAVYLKEHPEEWDQPAYVLVIKALKRAFPKN
jgi:hypothetical protein